MGLTLKWMSSMENSEVIDLGEADKSCRPVSDKVMHMS